LRLTKLTEDLESSFWDVVRSDYLDYYFFIHDLLLQSDKTEIFLVLENNSIQGLGLIFDGAMVQLRGSPDVVGFMLDGLRLEHVAVQVPSDCEDILRQKFLGASLEATISLMRLDRGDEHYEFLVQPQPLNFSRADQIAEIMQISYPKMWGDITKEHVQNQLKTESGFWLGVSDSDKLVSFGFAMLTPKVCHVTWLATLPAHQKKGYGLSVISGLVEKCLSIAPTAAIYVMDDNLVAKQLYAKIGFKPYKRYFFLKT
jgi:GNAT superfamily N-acetyltransferase